MTLGDDDATPTVPMRAICVEPDLAAAKLPPALAELVPLVVQAANAYQVDPFLLAAVCWRESNAQCVLGDGGHGHGLMQVDDRSHPEFCRRSLPDGTAAWRDALSNLTEGARILREECLDRVGQDVPGAVAAYNCGAGRVDHLLRSFVVKPPSLDWVARLDMMTTRAGPQDPGYVRFVLDHRDKWISGGSP